VPRHTICFKDISPARIELKRGSFFLCYPKWRKIARGGRKSRITGAKKVVVAKPYKKE
jgi:hypothetical protein